MARFIRGFPKTLMVGCKFSVGPMWTREKPQGAASIVAMPETRLPWRPSTLWLGESLQRLSLSKGDDPKQGEAPSVDSIIVPTARYEQAALEKLTPAIRQFIAWFDDVRIAELGSGQPRGQLKELILMLDKFGYSLLQRQHLFPERYQAHWEQLRATAFLQRFLDRSIGPDIYRYADEWKRLEAAERASASAGAQLAPSLLLQRYQLTLALYLLLPEEKECIGAMPSDERLPALYDLLEYKYVAWLFTLHDNLPFYYLDQLKAASIADRRVIAWESPIDTVERFLTLLQNTPIPREPWHVGEQEGDRALLEDTYRLRSVRWLTVLGKRYVKVMRNYLDEQRWYDHFVARVNEGFRGPVPLDRKERAQWLAEEIQRFVNAVTLTGALYILTYRDSELSFQAQMNIPSHLQLWESDLSLHELETLVELLMLDPEGVRATIQQKFGDPYLQPISDDEV